MLSNLLISIPDDVFHALMYVDDAIALLGGVLVGIGLAGRRAGWGPRCRACKFDLRGVTEDNASCPECGASLKPRKAIVFGARSRRWGMVVVGLLVASVATTSSVMGWPYALSMWREQVLASSFSLEDEIDLALKGNARALSNLQADLSGRMRRASTRVNTMPGQATLIALLERMEKDPTTRTALLPLVVGRGAGMNTMMWVRESVLPVRLAKILCDVAENDPTLFDSFSADSLNDLFRTNNGTALAELMTHPSMVARLYRGTSAPENQVSEGHPELTIRITPSFGGSNGGVWLSQMPVALSVTEATWRLEGEPESASRQVKYAQRVPGSGDAQLVIEKMPAKGTIILRAKGNVIQGPTAQQLRSKFDLQDTRQEGAITLTGNSTSMPFEWSRTLVLKPRADLVFTPIATGGLASWLDMTLERASLIKAPGGEPSEYLVMSELGTNINGAEVEVVFTLEQTGRAWKATEDRTRGLPERTFKAPEFDPTKPFKLHIEPSLEALRRRANADCTYLDLRKTLLFDATNGTPKEVKDLQSPVPAPSS